MWNLCSDQKNIKTKTVITNFKMFEIELIRKICV